MKEEAKLPQAAHGRDVGGAERLGGTECIYFEALTIIQSHHWQNSNQQTGSY